MPTDRISPSAPLVETLRALARERTGKTGKTGTDSATQQRGVVATPRSTEELRRRLAAVVESVDSNDPEALARSREPALREILLWEFGAEFRTDSQFLPMLDAIKRMLDEDPDYQQRFVELVLSLQKR